MLKTYPNSHTFNFFFFLLLSLELKAKEIMTTLVDAREEIHVEEELVRAPPQIMLHRQDSLDIESGSARGHQGHTVVKVWSWTTLVLAFQSIGVVYGDIGTSPLYVFSSTFTNGVIRHNDDVIGVLSLIFYTLSLLPILKYVAIVLRANDNGNGGTFALYSLLCRHVKVGLLPSTQAEDTQLVSTLPKRQPHYSSKIKNALENSQFAKFTLLFVTMLATALLIGDGILTPCISVMSAISGIKLVTTAMTEERVVAVTVTVLIILFLAQRLGTDKVGYCFAPIVCTWLILNAGIGLFNLIKYDPSVLKAINPYEIAQYFCRNGKEAWVSLGGIVLCVTGTEALFADLAHFTVPSIQISMWALVYPSLLCTYSGLASYLRHHPDHVSQAFYKSIPDPLYWPVFVVAVFATIIASQAMISGTFSIIQQSLSLGCFPRVTVVHTSTKYEGQVYIPELNYFLLGACICVTLVLKTTDKIGNAYGIAMVFAEVITSIFMVLVMILIWKKHVMLVITYVVVIMSVELIYLSSVLYKFTHGGYLPLAFACFFVLVMIVWNYVYRKKYYYEMGHKISPEKLREIVTRPTICKIPGLAIFYSELAHGIPPIFELYASNIPALHSVLVFVSFKSLPINNVGVDERFLFRRVETKEFYVFRCVVRYGYMDRRSGHDSFERLLLERMKEFVREESVLGMLRKRDEMIGEDEDEEEEEERRVREMEVEVETKKLESAWKAGVVHLMGESEVIAGEGSGLGKKIVIDYGYNLLKKNLRQTEKMPEVARRRLLKIGITYEL